MKQIIKFIKSLTIATCIITISITPLVTNQSLSENNRTVNIMPCSDLSEIRIKPTQ